MKVRYIGFFHDGPSYCFGGTLSEAEAFTSRTEAGSMLRERLIGIGGCDVAYPVCHDDMVATHVREEAVEIILATEDAYIDLYPVIPNDYKGWGYVAPEPECRIKIGPRGGILSESF